MIMHKVTTLNQFIIERQAEIPGATGEFSRLLHHIGIAAKKVFFIFILLCHSGYGTIWTGAFSAYRISGAS